MKISTTPFIDGTVGHTVHLEPPEQHPRVLPADRIRKQVEATLRHLDNGDSLSARQTSARAFAALCEHCRRTRQ